MTPEERAARTQARMAHLKELLSPEEWAQVVGGTQPADCPMCLRPAHPGAYCFGEEPVPVEDDALTYPHQSGDVTVIGPECFANAEGSVICWRGENYYRLTVQPEVAQQAVDAVGRVESLLERAQRHGYDLDPDDIAEALNGAR